MGSGRAGAHVSGPLDHESLSGGGKRERIGRQVSDVKSDKGDAGIERRRTASSGASWGQGMHQLAQKLE